MKKRKEKSFLVRKAKSIMFFVFLTAAAITVYGIANAALVGHSGSEITGKVAEAENSNRLQGVPLADILAAAKGYTYELNATGWRTSTGSYYLARTSNYTCPEGRDATITSCTQTPNCGCVAEGRLARVTASVYQSWSTGGGSWTGSCQPSPDWYSGDRVICSLGGACKMQIQCNKKETVGELAEPKCSTNFGIVMGAGTTCATADSFCNSRCKSAGWASGISASCVMKGICNQGTQYHCGLTYSINMHQITSFGMCDGGWSYYYPTGAGGETICQCSG